MKRKISFFLALILFSPVIHAGEDLSSLSSLIRQYEGKGIQVGVHVVSVTENQEVFAYKESVPLNPASNIKIITTAAALHYLGSNYTFKTRFYSEGAPVQGKITNLYVVGGGDPNLVEERLWRTAKDLSLRGIREITGDIVIDQSLFAPMIREGMGDLNRSYNAPITPLAVNYNSFAVVAQNTPTGIALSTDPPCDYFRIGGRVGTGGKGGLSVSRRFDGTQEVVTVSGSVKGPYSVLVYRNVSRPSLYAGSTLKLYLQQNGVHLAGTVREGPNLGTHLILEDPSKTLGLVIQDLNKFSNNFTAEMLLLSIGAAVLGAPATPEKGVTVLDQYLSGLGISLADYHLENGSGLSRNTRVAARVLTSVLSDTYRRFSVMPEFVSSLAIAGVDGTVRKRLKNPEIVGQTRVKTGTLNDASSLSGFIPTKSGKVLAFAIVAHGPGAGGGRFHQLQEKIALRLKAY
ncbi:MAG: D-alanyl-D-alanine carboxypeptidase/D-alanyl-D-alanine-endopeptidase [Deltaproteobacteria bacterium]|nr:D-alanyl-D-alanine carboxypeptidase/D-alanyl-D-alanine-endopeptidase [Deltaproteobacteria bacterium]